MKNNIFLIDAVLNFILGIILIFYPRNVIQFLGIPLVEQPVYASLLGATITGIGIALLVEYFRKNGGRIGLGAGGSIAINLSVGIVLIAWLIWGNLNIPLNGRVFLWGMVLFLILLSAALLKNKQ